jgi:MFS family permease
MNQARKNILFGVAHETIWGLSFALVDPITTLQLALNDLGGNAELAGLLGGLLFALANAPQMLSAFLFHPRWSDPKWCSLMHLPCVACTLGLAALFYFFPGMEAGLKLKLYLLLAAGFFVAIGFVVPHWTSLISRCVPEGVRGRYFAWCFSMANLGGMLSGVLAARFITQGGLAWGYGLCFLLAALLQLGSISMLSRVRPLEPRHAPPSALGPFLREQWALITGNKAFAAFAMLFVLMQFCGAPYALFTDFLKGRGLDTAWWGLYNAAKNFGGMLGSFLIGYLADKHGPRRGLYWAFAGMLFALILMPLPLHPAWAAGGFFGGGFFNSAFPVVNLYLFMQLAAPGQITAFTGTFSTLTSPVVFLAPLVTGWLAEKAGYPAAFALSAAACLGAILVVWRSRGFGLKSAAQP